jgi:hypothetical protein
MRERSGRSWTPALAAAAVGALIAAGCVEDAYRDYLDRLDSGEGGDAGVDAGTSGRDAGESPDAGRSDGGAPLPDAGHGPDAGQSGTDAGRTPDAGQPGPDAGGQADAGGTPDAGQPGPDGGSQADAGGSNDSGQRDSGICAQPFGAHMSFALPAVPSGVATADFNGDGRPDFAVSFPSIAMPFTIYLNQANGTFANTPGTTLMNHGALTIAAADLNNDGFADLVMIDEQSKGILVVLGGAGASFSLFGFLPTGGNTPVRIALADVNGDGSPDVLVTNSFSGSLSVFINHLNDGTNPPAIGPPIAYAAGTSAYGLVAAQFFSGAVDVLVSLQDVTGEVQVMVNDLAGDFSQGTLITPVPSVGLLAAGPLHAGGRADAVVADTTGGVRLLLNSGASLFAGSDISVGGRPIQVAIAPFTGGAAQDIAVAGPNGGLFAVLANDGAANFSLDGPYGAGSAVDMAVADFNKDGRPDVVVVTAGSQAEVFLNACP